MRRRGELTYEIQFRPKGDDDADWQGLDGYVFATERELIKVMGKLVEEYPLDDHRAVRVHRQILWNQPLGVQRPWGEL